jgi:hypothetical protein
VAHLETELNLASCTNGELDFLITPMKGESDRTLGSPRTPTGRFSIQTLLDLGEASLEVEDDFHELQLKHADAEVRVQSATFELQKKEQQLVELREIVSQMKVRLGGMIFKLVDLLVCCQYFMLQQIEVGVSSQKWLQHFYLQPGSNCR